MACNSCMDVACRDCGGMSVKFWKDVAEDYQRRYDLALALKDKAYRSRTEMHEEYMRLLKVLTPEQAVKLLDRWDDDA